MVLVAPYLSTAGEALRAEVKVITVGAGHSQPVYFLLAIVAIKPANEPLHTEYLMPGFSIKPGEDFCNARVIYLGSAPRRHFVLT